MFTIWEAARTESSPTQYLTFRHGGDTHVREWEYMVETGQN